MGHTIKGPEIYIWQIDFQLSYHGNSVKEKWSFQQLVLGQLDLSLIHI